MLNGYFEDALSESTQGSFQSRGEILPRLLSRDPPLEAAKLLDPKKYLSFRLLIGSPTSYVLYEWTGADYRQIDFHAHHESRVHFLCSSSWQQDEVTALRKDLFQRWVLENPALPTKIPSFHYCTEPNPESAVLMMR